ncbi:integrase domain-containing protein [Burkholderia multivorans]|nr:integrase domain-containing protein [Burkholderia multivorans]UXZ62827.1 integrase domain-containing protein [Burkholderia multivorans]
MRDELEPYRVAVAAIDPGIAVVLELQFELGLRAREAVQSIKSLADWRRALSSSIGDGFVTFIHGTKEGQDATESAIGSAARRRAGGACDWTVEPVRREAGPKAGSEASDGALPLRRA